ncbi:MAG TPA: PDZ domain-containing protein, partial [Planctomycetota bacterium]|nr:PDZ domain-containing protein [Planctomycetota bacterium]
AEPDVDEIRGYVGYNQVLIQLIEPEHRKEFPFAKERGLGVTHVLTNGPADKAGLKPLDILVELNGVAIPETPAIDPKDKEAAKSAADKWLKETIQPLTHKVRPGDTVKIVVERAGQRVTLEAVAVDITTVRALREIEVEEEVAVKVPAPKDRGTPAEATVDFETVPEGESVPANFLKVTGFFEVREEDGKPQNHVLVQDNDMGDTFAVLLLVADGRAYGDAKVSVRWMPISGEKSVSGGLIVRAQDRKNFVVVRADGVSRTLRVYVVKDGKAEVAASTDLPSPALGAWLPLEVTCKGTTVKAVLSGTTTVEATDVPWTTGWTGLSTWSDAVSAFDDLKIAPTK